MHHVVTHFSPKLVALRLHLLVHDHLDHVLDHMTIQSYFLITRSSIGSHESNEGCVTHAPHSVHDAIYLKSCYGDNQPHSSTPPHLESYEREEEGHEGAMLVHQQTAATPLTWSGQDLQHLHTQSTLLHPPHRMLCSRELSPEIRTLPLDLSPAVYPCLGGEECSRRFCKGHSYLPCPPSACTGCESRADCRCTENVTRL